MALEFVRNDDFVQYFLFPNIDQVSEHQEDEILNKILNQVNSIAGAYTSNYIWHKDPFCLKARNRNSHLLNPESKGESNRIASSEASILSNPISRTTAGSSPWHVVFRW